MSSPTAASLAVTKRARRGSRRASSLSTNPSGSTRRAAQEAGSVAGRTSDELAHEVPHRRRTRRPRRAASASPPAAGATGAAGAADPPAAGPGGSPSRPGPARAVASCARSMLAQPSEIDVSMNSFVTTLSHDVSAGIVMPLASNTGPELLDQRRPPASQSKSPIVSLPASLTSSRSSIRCTASAFASGRQRPERVQLGDDLDELLVHRPGIGDVVDLRLLEDRHERGEAVGVLGERLGLHRQRRLVDVEARVVDQQELDRLHPLGDVVLVLVDLVGGEALLHEVPLGHEAPGAAVVGAVDLRRRRAGRSRAGSPCTPRPRSRGRSPRTPSRPRSSACPGTPRGPTSGSAGRCRSWRRR